MTIYRSQEMGYYQMILRHESAFECISQLGELGLVEFEDMTPDLNDYQRTFVQEVRRCDAIESQVRFVDEEVNKEQIKTRDPYIPETPRLKQIEKVEAVLERYVSDLREHSESIVKMQKGLVRMKELTFVLTTIHEFFKEVDPKKTHRRLEVEERRNSRMAEMGTLTKFTEEVLLSMKLNFLVGVILTEKVHSFERVLWRFCRGNALVRLYPIETKLPDSYTNEQVLKSVYIIFFQGEETLMQRIKKLCEGFRTTVYEVPESSKERKILAAKTRIAMHDMTRIIVKTEAQRYLSIVAASKDITRWAIMVRKMKAVYHTLNLFSNNMARTSLIGKCWIPALDVPEVQKALQAGILKSGTLMPVILNPQDFTSEPPTYNRTNKFTAGFQALVDSYGVASYREINPALFTTITFPFIFAIMFGDFGHGLIMFLFAVWMVKTEKTFLDKRAGSEIWKIFFGGRYIILLMGMFSMYTGFIYNDCFSKSMNIFGSSWSTNFDVPTMRTEPELTLNPATKDYARHPYPFGLDPVWQVSHNQITFVNSYKMKISIIIGFMQMFAGVLLSIGNYIYFKKYINIFCEFIPQIIFLTCMFGYLVFLMFYKWFAYAPHNEIGKSPTCAPLILITFINMVMFKGGVAEPPCSPYMYPHQQLVEKVLIMIVMVCVPWMLFLKPFLIIRKQKRKMQQYAIEMEEMKRETHAQVTREKKKIAASRRETIINPKHITFDETQIENLEIAEIENTFNFNVFDDNPGKPGMPPRRSISQVLDLSHLNGDEDDDDEVSVAPELESNEGHGEIFIHQAIHTIEFVLGSVSHTASYLRLWALSLAHQQLSDVLWNMVLRGVLQQGFALGLAGTSPLLFIFFSLWATLTVSVLVLMEGLSAFLHTLRLHWVEFQSKFYSGLGHRFSPFCFTDVLQKLDAERYDRQN